MHSCENCENCKKTKHRTPEEKRKINNRLNIIEGQIKGIKKMIDEDRYCSDILMQIAAVNSSLKSLGKNILKNHLSTCVVDDIKRDNLQIIDEVIDLFERLK